MIWIFRFILIMFFMVILDGIFALLGLLFSKFSFVYHPWFHRLGLRFLAMSYFTYKKVLPSRCQLCCGFDQCRNWTCSEYSNKKQ